MMSQGIGRGRLSMPGQVNEEMSRAYKMIVLKFELTVSGQVA